MKKILLIPIFLTFITIHSAQNYQELIAEGTHTVAHIVEVAERHFDSIGRARGTGYKPFRRWQYFAERLMDETGKLKSPEFYYNELEEYNAIVNAQNVSNSTVVGAWEEIGPTYYNATAGWNPGVGRITSLAFENNNPNHIIAGANTGGVWKSLDGGSTWSVLTDNLSNIDVYALAMDPSNAQVYFWGSTNGTIFKSTDSGATWNLHATLPSGTINKILINPTNTQIMYASSEGSGVYKSFDGGFTWTIINSKSETGYDIEFKPGDYNTIYASGTKFFVSSDGGATFTTSDGLDNWSQEVVAGNNYWTTSSANQNNTVSPQTGNSMAFLYIGNFSSPVTQLISPNLDLSGSVNPRLEFSYTQVSWAGDQDEFKVLYRPSAFSGWVELANYNQEATIWTDVSISLPNATADYQIAFEGTANYGRGITIDDVVVRTDNIGIIFSDGFENTANEFSSGPKMIGVSPDDPSVLYLLESSSGRFKGLHKSIDEGETFQVLRDDSINYFGYSSIGDDNSGQAPRDMDIAINPNDINDVHIAGVNTWRSTDGGNSFTITSQWTPTNASNQDIGYCHADVDILEFVVTGASATLYAGTDGGIFKADNPTVVNSDYYEDLTAGMGIRQLYKLGISQTDPVVITAGSQDNGTSVYDVNGNWTDWLGADGMEGFVDKVDTQIMYGTTQFGGLNKTVNGGLTRFGLSNPAGNGNWNWVVPFEQDNSKFNSVYVAYKEVYKSNDGGATWVSISPNFGVNIDHFKIAPTADNKMYLAINGDFWYTDNEGQTWTQSSLDIGNSNINEIAVHPNNPDKIAIATTNSQKVYVSTDGGQNWTTIRWDLPDFSAQALAWQDNGEDGLYVGMNYGVYYTDNSVGNNWLPFVNGLPNVRISELEINTADNKIYAATYGRGIWRSNLYEESLGADSFVLNNLVLYPNPANNSVNLKWTSNDDVNIRIYNTNGKLLLYRKNERLTQGLSLDLTTFEPGVYFVKINTLKGQITKKLILY